MKSKRADPPQVSIALATYNGAHNLQEQLESLARQTIPPLELVVTDDGSTDETLTIVRQFARTVEFPVHIFANETRLGFANNFLKAASLCKGGLIGFCDQDDVWDEQKLDICASYFNDPDVVLSVHSASVWNGVSTTGQLFPNFRETCVHSFSSVDPFMLVPGFTMVFRSDLLRLTDNASRLRHLLNVGKSPSPMHHDAWVWFLGNAVGKVVTISRTLALYRQHNTNTIGAPPETRKIPGLFLSLSDTEYSGLATLESECAERILSLDLRSDAIKRGYAIASAQSFALRSDYHKLRSVIYDRQSNLLDRSRCFIKLLTSGAYRSEASYTFLGSRAAVKDLCFGVPGVYRWTRSAGPGAKHTSMS